MMYVRRIISNDGSEKMLRKAEIDETFFSSSSKKVS